MNRLIKTESLCVQKLGRIPVVQRNQRRYNSHISNTIVAEIFGLHSEEQNAVTKYDRQ
jgi:hypothetical protein